MDGINVEWFRHMVDVLGELPPTYYILDTETSGVVTDSDLILQVGCAFVRDRVLQDHCGLLFDWTSEPSVNQNWLRNKITDTAAKMREKGVEPSPCLNYDRLAKEGVPPREGLAAVHSILANAKASGIPFVAHNGWRFDSILLSNHIRDFLKIDFEFGGSDLIDTGAIEKGSQANILPAEAQDWRGFTNTVTSMPLRIKWSLDRHCVPKYRLREKLGQDVVFHDAVGDCITTHYLFETYRSFTQLQEAKREKEEEQAQEAA